MVICRYKPPEDLLRESSSSAETVRAILQRAVAKTVLENPLLQAVQYGEDSASPAWRRVDEIDLNRHIHLHSISIQDDYESQLKQKALKTMDTWFTDAESRPGWDVQLFHRDQDYRALDIMFSWNHAHLDGVAGKLFHQQILRHLNEPDSGNECQISSSNILRLPDATKRFPPPQEELIKYSLSVKYTVSTLWQELQPQFLAQRGDHSAYWCPIRETPMETSYSTIEVDASAVRNLLKLCNQHETSLTGLIHALVAVSLSLQLSNHSPQPKSFKACTPIDHRRYITSLPPTAAGLPDFDAKDSMMNIFSTMWHDLSPTIVEEIRKKALKVSLSSPSEVITAIEQELWLVAATIRREIQQRVDKGPKDDVAGLTKFIKDWRSHQRGVAQKPRVGSWLVTNLGLVDPGNNGPWSITRSSFLNPAEMCSAAVCITAISVKGGSLTLGVSWQKCVMESSIAEQLVMNIRTWLNQLSTDVKGLDA